MSYVRQEKLDLQVLAQGSDTQWHFNYLVNSGQPYQHWRDDDEWMASNRELEARKLAQALLAYRSLGGAEDPEAIVARLDAEPMTDVDQVWREGGPGYRRYRAAFHHG